MANTALNRTIVVLLTNKSGGAVAQGDVVVLSTGTAAAFTTTTSAGYVSGPVGVVVEPNGIANDAIGLVAFGGYVPKIGLSGAASLGDLVKTHSVAKQGVRHAAPAVAGDFAAVLGTGTSPAAVLFGIEFGIGTGGATHTVLHDSTLGVAGRFDVSGISQSYQHLLVQLIARSSVSAIGDSVFMYANADVTATNYNDAHNITFGSPAANSPGNNANPTVAAIPGATSPANSFGSVKIWIPFYTDTNYLKVAYSEVTHLRDTNIGLVGHYSWNWESTAAINQLTIQPDGYSTDNFAINTRLQIIGVNFA